MYYFKNPLRDMLLKLARPPTCNFYYHHSIWSLVRGRNLDPPSGNPYYITIGIRLVMEGVQGDILSSGYRIWFLSRLLWHFNIYVISRSMR